jgi:imidazolonepropionase-like amidohydrolase
MILRSLFILALFLLVASAPRAGASSTRTIYRHASLIDGTGRNLQPDMAVVVAGERILAVVPDSRLSSGLIAGGRQVDLDGKYLLPGFIDSHQHFATPPNRKEAEARLKRDLFSGITATRDMADDLRQVADLARAARVGEIPSPDISYAALMAGPSFFDDPRTQSIAKGAIAGEVPWEQAIDNSTDIRLAVARAKGTSATAVKIYANLPGPLVAKIIAEAHRQGMRAWAHAMVFPATPEEIVNAGVDTVSHSCYLAYQAMPARPGSYQQRFPIDMALFDHDNPILAKLFGEMARQGTILDATLHVYREVEAGARKQGKPPLCTMAFAGKLTNQAFRAGVQISSGTDGDAPNHDPWPSLFDEFNLLHDLAGLPPMAVIEAATRTGARAIAAESEMGTITPGKLANMVVLRANPLADVRNMRTVVMTVKRGRAYLRADYQAAHSEQHKGKGLLRS